MRLYEVLGVTKDATTADIRVFYPSLIIYFSVCLHGKFLLKFESCLLTVGSFNCRKRIISKHCINILIKLGIHPRINQLYVLSVFRVHVDYIASLYSF